MATAVHLASAVSVLGATFLVVERRVRLPDADEAAFWRSGTTAAWLRTYDLMAGVSVLMAMRTFNRKFDPVLKETLANASYEGWVLDVIGYAWHMRAAFSAVAVLQMVAVALAPAAYSKIRTAWMVLARLLRLFTVAAEMVVCARRSPAWEHLAEALRRGPSPAVSLLVSYSAASLGVMHALNMFMPLRWSAVYQLLMLGIIVPVGGQISQELLHPAVRGSYLRLCRPLPGTLGDLTGSYVTDAEAEAWCLRHPRVLVTGCQVVLSCVLPLLIVATVEGGAKRIYLQSQRHQGWLQQQPGPQHAAMPTALGDGHRRGSGADSHQQRQQQQGQQGEQMAHQGGTPGPGGLHDDDDDGPAATGVGGGEGGPGTGARRPWDTIVPVWLVTEACRFAAMLLAMAILDRLWDRSWFAGRGPKQE